MKKNILKRYNYHSITDRMKLVAPELAKAPIYGDKFIPEWNRLMVVHYQ